MTETTPAARGEIIDLRTARLKRAKELEGNNAPKLASHLLSAFQSAAAMVFYYTAAKTLSAALALVGHKSRILVTEDWVYEAAGHPRFPMDIMTPGHHILASYTRPAKMHEGVESLPEKMRYSMEVSETARIVTLYHGTEEGRGRSLSMARTLEGDYELQDMCDQDRFESRRSFRFTEGDAENFLLGLVPAINQQTRLGLFRQEGALSAENRHFPSKMHLHLVM